MMRVRSLISLIVFIPLTGAAACVNVQELGADRPGETASVSSARPEAKTPPALTPRNDGYCPSHAPARGTDCAAFVGWCSYRVAPRDGLAAKCACGSGRRWSCLTVRDDDRRNEIPVESLTLTTASCTEGAPCGEGSKCRVGKERACECMSSGRLRCERPLF